jgi:TPR repeat protein
MESAAPENGDSLSQLRLGELYSGGLIGLPRDYAKAFYYYTLSANQGVLAAMMGIAELYQTGGPGLPKDDAQAFAWWSKAAEANSFNPKPSHMVALAYYEGVGVPMDMEKGFELFKKEAAKSGYAPSINSMGLAYARGQGVERNPQEATRCFNHTASQGDAWGQAYLAFAYGLGDGVPRDFNEANRLFNLAVAGGDLEVIEFAAERSRELGLMNDANRATRPQAPPKEEGMVAKLLRKIFN